MKQPTEKPFKPDVVVTISHDTKTGQTQIATGNGQLINPLFLIALLSGVVQGNANALLSQQVALAPHKFFALDGETICRFPRCGRGVVDPLHITEDANKSQLVGA